MAYIYMFGALLLCGAAVFGFFLSLYEPVTEKVKASTDTYVAYMREQADSMFLEISPRRCVMIIASSTAFGALVALLILSGKEFSWGWVVLRLILMGVLGYLGWTIPRRVLAIMWRRRVDKFDDQMLDALVLMSNALKAGLSFIQAMDTVVKEMPNPIGQEFGLVLRQQQLGQGVNESLQALEARMQTEDIKIIVTAIMILRDTGGNLSETFDTIAYTIRERKKVKGKIQALTAQGVMQGIIIFCMPFGLGTILYIMDPVLISRMWQTILGIILLGVMLLLQGVGGLIMKKVVTIEV